MSRVRLLGGVATTLALALALLTGSASAKTVYDYEYSGTYFDGSGAGKAFGTSVSGLAYDAAEHVFFVADGGMTGSVSKLTPSGAGVDFSALGSPRIVVHEGAAEWEQVEPTVSVDQYGGGSDGNFYVASDWGEWGFHPNGTALPPITYWEGDICGAVPEPLEGEGMMMTGRGGFYHFALSGGEPFKVDYLGAPGYQPGVKRKWGEIGKSCRTAVDGNGDVYGRQRIYWEDGPIVKTDRHGLEKYEVTLDASGLGDAVDLSDDDVFVVKADGTFERYDSAGRLTGSGWGGPEPAQSYPGLAPGSWGIAVDPETHDVWIANRHDYGGGVAHVEKFVPTNPHVIPDATAIKPDYNSPTGDTIVLRAEVDPDGVETTDCHFEYGTTQSLGTSLPCTEGDNLTGSGPQIVTSPSIPVTKGQRYWYRVFVNNTNDDPVMSNSWAFLPQGLPILKLGLVDRINTDGGRARAEFDPNGGNAGFHLEYGVKGGPLDQRTQESPLVGFKTQPGIFVGEDIYQPGVYSSSILFSGLEPGTTYEYRIVADNEAGSTPGPVGEFTTYKQDPGTDPCPNSLARQQSGSSLLLECRGYELVSAANAGGYDVESDTVAGESPLAAYPRAHDRLLYSLHFGVVPGIAGSPTNYGLDPYVAVRGADGWKTEYVGLPSDGMAEDGAFGSPLLGSDPSLREFAFGGPGICNPCFDDGSVNVPLRAADGGIGKGMQGSLDPGAAGNPSETVLQPFSADGDHFVFGSDAPFETNGDPNGSIYERNLASGGTEVVSTLPNGSAMGGGEVAELAVSADGSRVLIGKQVGADAKGNPYYHLYLHLAGTAASLDLTPGAAAGALFDGMNESGSMVFFTTKDQLAGGDSDESADVYEAAVDGGGPQLRLVSTAGGAARNDDSCAPEGSPSWNSPAGNGKCGALAFAGGAGIAAESGTFFFLSPELLDGASGTQDDPNLYVVKPGGDPEFVATIDSAPIDDPAIAHAVEDAAVHDFGDFQVTQSGRYAAFASKLPLTGFPNLGHSHVYRYDGESGGGSLVCATCAPTGAATAFDTTLTATGLNLTDDGRVFFTTRESLALRDTNELSDAYEWSHGETQLISTGIGADPSSLVTVSADGEDAFFFTRESLVPEDENGHAVKIYDAREGGGSAYDPPQKLCAASDECHGAGSQPPGPPAITTVTGAGPNPVGAKRCRKGFVRRHGKCVRKHRKHPRHHKAHRRNG